MLSEEIAVTEDRTNEGDEDFRQQIAGERRGVAAEMLDFLRNNKKWWLTPIVLVVLGLGLLVLLGGSAAAPFIYTLF
ncbi:MAG: hypothetical protein H6719_06235 [Sandaracinaceae bacterium]|nr:hypothetical protein [Sandaracinaceae bacterium]